MRKIQIKRSSTANSMPAASTLKDGELAINLKDASLFAGDGSKTNSIILKKTGSAFSSTLSYKIGDTISNQGKVYIAKVDISPKIFTPAEWDLVGTKTVDKLSDTDILSPAIGDVLFFDSKEWINKDTLDLGEYIGQPIVPLDEPLIISMTKPTTQDNIYISADVEDWKDEGLDASIDGGATWTQPTVVSKGGGQLIWKVDATQVIKNTQSGGLPIIIKERPEGPGNAKIKRVGIVTNAFDAASDASTIDSKIKVSGGKHLTSAENMFYNLAKVTSVDIRAMWSENITNMKNMFLRLESVTQIDLSNLNTSKVTTMEGMFSGFSNNHSYEVLDLTNFDTSKVQNFSRMFYMNFNVKPKLNKNFIQAAATDISEMFRSANSIEVLDLSGSDTSNVTDMTDTFGTMGSLKSLDIRNFDVSNVLLMNGTFYGVWNSDVPCDIHFFDMSKTKKVQEMRSMFAYSNINNFTAMPAFDSVTNTYSMFYESQVKNASPVFLDEAALDMPELLTAKSMFHKANLKLDDNVTISMPKVTHITQAFSEVKIDNSVLNLNLDINPAIHDMSRMFEKSSLKDTSSTHPAKRGTMTLAFAVGTQPKDMSFMFSEFAGNVSIKNIDVSLVTTTESMFSAHRANDFPNIFEHKTWKSLTSAKSMFSGAQYTHSRTKSDLPNINQIVIEDIDFKLLTDVTQMFSFGTSSYYEGSARPTQAHMGSDVSLKNIKMPVIKSFFQMFAQIGCYSITCDIDAPLLENVSYMFNHSKYNSSFTYIDVSKISCANVTDMRGFVDVEGCRIKMFGDILSVKPTANMNTMFGASFTHIDKLDTTNATDTTNLFGLYRRYSGYPGTSEIEKLIDKTQPTYDGPLQTLTHETRLEIEKIEDVVNNASQDYVELLLTNDAFDDMAPIVYSTDGGATYDINYGHKVRVPKTDMRIIIITGHAGTMFNTLQIGHYNKIGQVISGTNTKPVKLPGKVTFSGWYRGCFSMFRDCYLETYNLSDADLIDTYDSVYTNPNVKFLEFGDASDRIGIHPEGNNNTGIVNFTDLVNDMPDLTCVDRLNFSDTYMGYPRLKGALRHSLFDKTNVASDDVNGIMAAYNSASTFEKATVCEGIPPAESFHVVIESQDNPGITHQYLVTTKLSDGVWEVKGTNRRIRSFDITNKDITKVTFKRADDLAQIDSLFKNSNVQEIIFEADISKMKGLHQMASAFEYCDELHTITGFEHVDTSNVDNFNNTFRNCIKLKFDDIKTINLSSAIYLYSTFNRLSSTAIDLSGTSIDKATNVSSMFGYCPNLLSIKMPSGAPIANFGYMFSGCTELLCIDKLDTTNATKTDKLFDNTPKLLHPDAPTQTALISAAGLNWTNVYPCPDTSLTFIMEVESDSAPEFDVTGGTIKIEQI